VKAILTNSRLRSARRCLREEHIQFVLGYRPRVKTGPRLFGSLFHHAQEAWWRAPNNRLDAAMAALLTFGADVEPFDMARAQVLMAGYDARWLSKMDDYEVLGVEVHFHMPLRNPATGRMSQTWDLDGVIDAIVRERRTGKVFIVEHKTSGEDIAPGSTYWQKLRLDSQVSTYLIGAKSLGYEAEGCIYDVIGKPKQKPSEAKKETPDDFRARLVEVVQAEPNRWFQRDVVVRLQSEIDEFLFETWQQAQTLHAAHVAGIAPRNTDSCFKFNNACDFWPVCSGIASLEDATRYVQNDNKHPELPVAEESAS
jgi:hypothetical protein